jgi:hypothetical protein|tara:strand:- start:287 stop:511 length:225 start_codon:yes stop_codon:yes gene_type:complete
VLNCALLSLGSSKKQLIEYIDVGEWGLALEILVDEISEYEWKINEEAKEKIINAFRNMNYKDSEINRIKSLLQN